MSYLHQLQTIKRATGWSQETLARQLDVSQVTLNFWLNERSVPRHKKQLAIERLYIRIVGSNDVDQELLQQTRTALAQHASITARDIIKNKQLLDTLTLHFTYHTNTIEGSTMTIDDVEEVLFENSVLTNRTAIEQLEARNHQAALHWLLNEITTRDNFVIDEATILGIHQRLMNGISSDAGIYRQHGVRIIGSRVPLANWRSVPTRLVSLLQSGAFSSRLTRDIARAHAEFEQIHPFSDGNGRTGRLLMLAQALRAKTYPPLIEKERKYAYYRYLALAQTTAQYHQLELFILDETKYAAKLLGDHNEN